MFKTLTGLISWTSTDSRDEWRTWEEWQRHQPPAHYEKSDIFQYYLSYRPKFQPPRYSCASGYQSKYFIYCFGDFCSLLVNSTLNGDAIEYFITLLDIYDVCKGFSRRLTGDPQGIAIIREVVLTRTLFPLQKYDFNQCAYNYDVIHAHTVAQYSLSTLLMRLVSQYMSYAGVRGYYPAVAVHICQKAYEECVFGAPVVSSSKSISINIPRKNKPEELRGVSWPRDQSTCLRCKTCNRVTENTWGNFNTCLDCHMKRICSICGAQAIIIGMDDLPKCYIHQDNNL